MYPHHANTRNHLVLLALAAVLVTGTVFPGFSRDRSNGDTRPRAAHNRQPQRVEAPRRAASNRHYSYRNGSWFSVTPRARIAVGAPFGALVLSLPGIFRTAVFGGLTYHYCDGVFYHHHPYGYEVVRPPRVRYLPRGARRVVIGGCAYFHHDNFYYCYRSGFFEVCEPPVVVADDVDAVSATTIMIENSNGSRTPVNLEPMGSNQWKGPKGEIYDGIPTDNQLRQAYGF